MMGVRGVAEMARLVVNGVSAWPEPQDDLHQLFVAKQLRVESVAAAKAVRAAAPVAWPRKEGMCGALCQARWPHLKGGRMERASHAPFRPGAHRLL